MKTNRLVLTLAISLLVACALPETKITSPWSRQEKNTNDYERLFVATMVSDVTKRQANETNIDAVVYTWKPTAGP